jgi:hypothetical protein
MGGKFDEWSEEDNGLLTLNWTCKHSATGYKFKTYKLMNGIQDKMKMIVCKCWHNNIIKNFLRKIEDKMESYNE